MAVISVPGQSGRSYSVRIAGDTPTPQEQANIDAYVSRMEGSFAPAAPTGGGGVGTAFGVGVDVLQQGYGSAVEGIGSLLGSSGIENYGKSVADANSREIAEKSQYLTGRDDISGIGDALSYFGETLAQQFPQIGVSLGGAAAGAAVGSAVPLVGTAIGAAIGGTLANLPFFYGQNRERQKEAIEKGLRVEMDEGAAALSAIPQAALDAIVDRFMIGKVLNPDWLKAGGIFTRGVKGATSGVVVEVPTEIGQSVIERFQAGLPIDDEEAFREYEDVAIAAGLVGGTVSGVAGISAGDIRKKKEAEREKEALDQLAQDQDEAAAEVSDRIKLGLAAADKEAQEAQVSPRGMRVLALPKPSRLTPDEEVTATLASAQGKEDIQGIKEGDTVPTSKRTFDWEQYDAAVEKITSLGRYSAPAIQSAVKKQTKNKVPMPVVRDIRDEMVRRGLLRADTTSKTGYVVEPKKEVPFTEAESFQKTIDQLDRDIEAARKERDKSLFEVRKLEQTGATRAKVREAAIRAEQLDASIAQSEGVRADVVRRLANVKQSGVVPTTERPRSLVDEQGRAPVPITEAPAEVQAVAVQDRAQRLSAALKGYEDRIAQQKAILKRLKADAKKVQLPKSELAKMKAIEDGITVDQYAAEAIRQRIKNPSADIQIAQERAAANEARAAAAKAEVAKRTPAYSAKEFGVFNALRKRLSNLGLSDVNLTAEKIIRPAGADPTSLVEGVFDVKDGNRVIALSMGIYDPKLTSQQLFDRLAAVMNHEVIHALRNLGLFTDAEWKSLSELARRQKFMKVAGGKSTERAYTYFQRAQQMYKGATEDVVIEEAVAEMFRAYVDGTLKVGGKPRTLMDRIKNFFKSIWGAHVDADIDPNTIFEGVRFGKIGRRERKPTAEDQEPRASKAMVDRAKEAVKFSDWFDGSQAVDANGEPQVYYTGTSKDKDFTSFNVGRHGAWFTTDPTEASNYAFENDSMGYRLEGWDYVKTNTASRVIPAFLRITNPYRGPLPQSVMRENYKKAQSDWFDTLRAQGYDGWMPESDGSGFKPNIAVALGDPTQIKSVFAKEFDVSKNDMRMSMLSGREDGEISQEQAYDTGRDEGKDVGGSRRLEAAIAARATGSPVEVAAQNYAARATSGNPEYGQLTPLDLDNLTPEFFSRPGWAILTATDTTDNGQFKEQNNARAHEQLRRDMEYRGIPYRIVEGMYQGEPDGISYIILADEPTAMKLGDTYRQESILTNRGLIYSSAPLPRTIRKEGIYYGEEAKAKDFWTDLGEGRAFSLDLDFEGSGPNVPDIGPGYYTIDSKPQLPIRASDGMVELHHWSDKQLDVVDPAFAGTGPLKGVERGRGDKVSFFGINPRENQRAQGTGYVKEYGLGDYEHIALVKPDDLYPWFTDPEGLSEGLDKTDKSDISEYQRRIRNAGYKGYYTERIDAKRTPLGNVATMFEKVKVKPAQQVQLGLRNQTRYSVLRGLSAPLSEFERNLTVLDRMDERTGEFRSDGKKRRLVEAYAELNDPRADYKIEDDGQQSRMQAARLVLAELRQALVRNPEAIGWYGTTLAKAKRVAAILHPEISPVNPYSGAKSNSYDPIAEHAWDLAMAITSNGMAVSENAKFANKQYEHWRDTGRFLEEGTGEQGSGMVAAFRTYNAMKDKGLSDEQIADFLSEKLTVRDLRSHPVIVELGIDVGSNESVDTEINGSYIFGPKIGQGFYQNLRGNFDPLTIDIWFMRMFNRITGRPFRIVEPALLEKNANRVVEAANAGDLTDYDRETMAYVMDREGLQEVTPENAHVFAVAFDRMYQRDYKKFYDDAVKASGLDKKSNEAKEIGNAARPPKSELSLAAKTFRFNLEPGLQDAPRNASDRTYMRAVIDLVREALSAEGTNISTADVQAVLWYAEKQLLASMGVTGGKGADNDYVDGAIELLRSKGLDDGEIARSLPGSERDRLDYRTASERAAARLRQRADTADEVEGGGRFGDVSEEAIRVGQEAPTSYGSEGSTRYSVIPGKTSGVGEGSARWSQASQQANRVAQAQSGLMYARSADLIAKVLNLGGVGVRKDRAQEIADGILRRFQDSMLPVGRMVQELNQNGMTITDAMDPYLREELMHGIVGDRIEQNQKTLMMPVLEAIKRINVTDASLEALRHVSDASSSTGRGYATYALKDAPSPRLALADVYLYARHAKERNRWVKENRDETSDAGSGMSDAEADAILNWFNSLDADNKLAVREMALGVRAIVADTNKTRLDAGLINQDMIDEGTQWKFYVPLRGKEDVDGDRQQQDEIAGPPARPRFGARGREDMRALGRDGYASDIIANLMTQNQNAILRAERNKVGQSFLNLLRADPSRTSAYATILDRRPMMRGVTSSGKVRMVVDPMAHKRPDMLVVKEDGKEVFVQFDDLRLAGALNGQNGFSPNTGRSVINALGKINRYLSSINTSYNPEFVISNMVRDLQTAGVNLNQYEKDGLTKEVVFNVKNALVGIKKSIRNDDNSSEWSKLYRDFVNAGGQNSTNMMNSVADQMENIKGMLGDISTAGTAGKWAKVKNGFVGKGAGSVLKFLEDYNTVVENGVRVATYKALLDRGFTRDRAAQAARNVTVNFAKGGDYRALMNSFYLFYNASLQGTFAMLNAAVRSPRVRKVWASIIVAGIIQDQLNAMLSPEDDDGERVYDKIPDYILEHNLILPDVFGISDRSYISIPLPYGLNMALNAGRSVSRAYRGAYDGGEAAKSIIGTAIEVVNPLGGLDEFSAGGVASAVSPTATDPFVELMLNRDFSGKPIYKEALPFDRTPDPASQRYWSTTSPSAIWVAQNLNSITGGNAVRSGFADWSPDVMQYWFEFLTGGVGRFAMRSAELMPRIAEGEGITDDLVRNVPLVRKLVGSVSEREDMGGYIEKATKVLMAGEELKQARENGDAQWARDTIATYGKELRVLGQVKAFESALRKINKQMNAVKENTRIPEDRRRQIVDALSERKQMILSRANRLMSDI